MLAKVNACAYVCERLLLILGLFFQVMLLVVLPMMGLDLLLGWPSTRCKQESMEWKRRTKD